MIVRKEFAGARPVWMHLLAIGILGVASAHLEAQNINAGEIRGVVTDITGAAVPNAAVSLTNTDTGVVTKVTANASGVYDVPQLTPGSYTVSVEAATFKTYVESNVLLRTAPIQVNAVLAVGTVGEQMTVNANNQAELQTEDSESNLTLDETTVTSLPNVGNTWFNETVLIPGVNGGGSQNQNGAGIGINGAESYQENFLLNGGIETFIGSQNPDWIIEPTDFIAETQFETHNFNAASGGGLAVLNIITKNGTNKFHGSFWDYNQNAAFAAQNYFSGGSGVPPSAQNTFGGTASGPIFKDKLFFFGGYQRQILNAGTTGVGSVPTAAMKAGNFAGLAQIFDPTTTTTVNGVTTRQPFANNQIPNISQQAKNWEQFFPDPNYGDPGAITGNYRYSEQVHDVTDWYTGKIDYQLSPTNHANASGTYGDVLFPNPSLLNPIGEFAEHGHEFATQVSDTWIPSSTWVNEARFAVVRFFGYWDSGDLGQGYPAKIGIPGTYSDVWPSLNISSGVYSYGAGLQANISENEYVPSDVVTLVRGKHIIKFGGEFDAGQVNGNFSGYSDGNFNFNGDSTRDPRPATKTFTPSNGVGYADFLLGDVSSWNIGITPEAGGRLKTYQVFAQDDYKIRPNLTLNLGFRYEIQPGWGEAQNRQGDFDPTLLNPATGTLGAVWFAKGANGVNGRTKIEQTNYIAQPRVGFSWQPKQSWTVRAGYGIYAELLGQNTYGGDELLGISGTNGLSETDGLNPVFTLAQGAPQPIFTTTANLRPDTLNGQSVGYNPYHTKVPTIQEFQFDTQHEFGRGIIADLAYVGTLGRHIPLSMDYNQIPESDLHLYNGSNSLAAYRPFPQYQSIPTTIGAGVASYNALQGRLQKQFAAGWQFSTAFTYSHTLDEGTGSGNGGAGAKGDVWQNGYNPASNYGNSLLDQRLSFNGDMIYDLPVGKGKMFLNQGGVVDSVIGGWRLAGLWQLHTGTPFTPVLQTNVSGSLAGTQYPNRVGGGKMAHPTLANWYDTSAFVQPADGTYGNSGRNILYGPGWQQLDLSLQKHWAVPFFFGERGDIQVRVDASDLTNHANFGQPNSSLALNPCLALTTPVSTCPTTPQLVTAGAFVDKSNVLHFAQQITSSNTSRAIQFEGKFSF